MKSYLRVLVSLIVVFAAAGVVPTAAVGQSTDASASGVVNTTVTVSAEETQFPITLTDATGTEVTIEERPERVTTTNPSAAQVMWELGAQSQVVGLSKFAHYLEGAESRMNVSSTDFGVSIERVVATEPDLVLAPNATNPETVSALRHAGLTVYHFPEATSFEDVAEKTLTIGQLTGNYEAAVETNAWMDANVEAVSAATADVERPRLMYPLLGGFAVGGDTFIHEIIVASGAENLAATEFDGYKVVNDETVLTLDPEVVIVTDQTEGLILSEAPYSLTTAGENGRSVFLEVNYINQPAPRSVVYSTRNLTAQLHPEVYDESDFVTRAEAAASVNFSIESDGSTDDSTATDDAEGDDNVNANADADATADDGTSVSAPGFGAIVAVLSVLGIALLGRFRSSN